MNMIGRISQGITDELVKNKIINEYDLEIYSFGIYQGIGFIFNIMTTILIFSLFDMFIQGLIFSTCYFCIRSYAGGFHSESVISCYILSIILILISSVAMSLMKMTLSLWILFIILWLFIFVYAPVDTNNKRLDQLERKVYQNKSRIILIIMILMVGVFQITSFNAGYLAVVMSVYLEGSMLVIGEAKNYLANK